MTDTATRLIGIAIPTLRDLRAAALGGLTAGTSGEADAVDALREAGFSGGVAVFDAFEEWLQESKSDGTAGDLSLEEFGQRAAEYFRAAGWGLVDFDPHHSEGTASLTMSGCWEADGDSSGGAPTCHVTTGMLAAFFGKLAGYPVAVMETECRSAGADRCRFLLGNSDVMTYRWEQMRVEG